MLKFVGKEKGLEGVHGVPARDLTEKEIKEWGLDRKALVRSRCYEEVKPAKKKRRRGPYK